MGYRVQERGDFLLSGPMETGEAIPDLATDKATGPDSLPVGLFRNLLVLVKPLRDLASGISANGNLPESLAALCTA